MTPFLKQVARHYFSAGGTDGLCFILPNRRAAVFFRKYLGECVAQAGRPMRAPAIYTMNDFFYAATGMHPTDPVHLLLALYDCYKPLYEKSGTKAESLDDFIFWGGVLLSDFGDVDKYLVDPERLFTNIADFRALQDDFDYLDEKQVEAIRQFLSHFRTGGKYKDAFRRIWDILLPLYRDFNRSLKEAGMSYEGQVYRALAERLKEASAADVLVEPFPDVRKFIFVGHNALNACEKRLMHRLRDARLAEFCWDYGKGWISDPHNKSSLFLSQNVREFPQAFDPDPEGLGAPRIRVLGVPSGVGQAKQLPAILEDLGAGGIETAVVLPDENLLIPVLNSVPEQIRDINVTMGYPMSGSSLSALMDDVAALQMHLREKDGAWSFYHRQVWSIFSNSIFKSLAGDEGQARIEAVRKARQFYIPQADLNGIPLFDRIFRPVVKDPGAADAESIRALEEYQADLLSDLGRRMQDKPELALEQDFAREYYLAVRRLQDCRLEVLPATYFRLLGKLLAATAVPFRGEPLKGLQIMGPLETRVLDFDNLVVLSCNEGVFPHRNVAASFVPAELRRGFGLPTYEYQDAVWAYYFYRMVRRAKNVWLLHDTRTEGVRTGEESRYIKQLALHFGVPVERYVQRAAIGGGDAQEIIPKTADHVRTLREKNLSASALQNYLACPAKFYYASVCGLKEKEEVAEALEANGIGNVYHHAMQDLYGPAEQPHPKEWPVTREYLVSLLKGGRIREEVRRWMLEELNSDEVTGRNIIFEDMIRRYVRKTVERDVELLDARGADRFRMLGAELRRTAGIDGFHFVGYIDRLDSVSPGEVRVVDYKTGKVTDEDFRISDENAESVVEAVFGADNSKRPKIALQLYLYDRFISGDPAAKDCRIVNSVYQPSRLFVQGVEQVAVEGRFVRLMEERLHGLLAEIADLSVPFRRTEDTETCGWCDFKNICGR
ncbi:MAG: PD-(D/E)XK nuclease family protein [Bacteroidales bacterium]|nr:PD-(D/E)XK nuclease family protein [Bacteroidales bacterium]